jgi:hypothetical protein
MKSGAYTLTDHVCRVAFEVALQFDIAVDIDEESGTIYFECDDDAVTDAIAMELAERLS